MTRTTLVCATLLALAMLSCSPSAKTGKTVVSLAKYREHHLKSLVDDLRSPITAQDLPHIEFYPENKAWKFTCTCDILQGEKPFELPTYSGITRTYIRYATANCKYKTKPFKVTLYKNLTQPSNPLYSDHLFLPFKDHTNGEESYGGGRYLDLKATDIIGGSITIDFNRCYNPWCAYSDGYNCPIPPRENHLEITSVPHVSA